MNQWIIKGRLTKDVETQQYGETRVASFTLALNNPHKETADFFKFKAFGKIAETIATYIKKGSLVLVTATIQNNIYKDKNGSVVYGKDNYIVKGIEFLDNKAREMTPNESIQNIEHEPNIDELYDVSYEEGEYGDY